MTWILDPFLNLLGIGLLLVFALALTAPFEPMGWWAGWSKRHLEPEQFPGEPVPRSDNTVTDVDHFIVYFTGVTAVSRDFLARREIGFLKLLAKQLPGKAVIVRDVFPFSTSNNPLNGERVLGRVWQWIHNRRVKNPAYFLAAFIDLRNVFHIAVSADPRYGPINNVGMAQEIAQGLCRHGYPVGSGKPITLIGLSGSAQIAVGATPYLKKVLQAPIRVIAVGGVLTDDPGIADVEHLYQLKSSKDFFPYLGNIFYPGRWPFLSYSAWNQARRQGKITVIDPGPMHHIGRKDYFSFKTRLPNGQCHAERTAEIVAKVVTDSL